jgi:hypothetical protein
MILRPMTVGLAVAAILLAPVGTAFASDTPQRPGDVLVPVAPSENGGDNGWGNCGHNSSGGDAHSGTNGEGGGNGGYARTDCVETSPVN